MTNNKFKLIELSDNSMLIISTSWDAIDNYLSELTFELNGKFSNSLLVFDLLVKNGLKDRYYRSQFKEGHIMLNSFEKIASDSLSKEIIIASNNFFKSNRELIDQSFMTKAQKFMIKRELANV